MVLVDGFVTPKPTTRIAATPFRASSPGGVAITDKPDAPEGSHEELMYALGVNLARQLGDIRPLVENGDELAMIAKGLLDVFIGRFTEDGQSMLLQRRGDELNQLVAGRA